jgi:hypothetical protein
VSFANWIGTVALEAVLDVVLFLPFRCTTEQQNSGNWQHKAKVGNSPILEVMMRDPAVAGIPPQRAANDVFSAC